MLGFFAMRVLSFGMFAVGAALGVILVSALKTTLIAEMYPKDPKLAFIIAAVVAGLAFGLLAMCLQKQMLIFSTAYAGSCACVFGIGHFAGHFPTTDDLSAVEAGKFNAWVVLYVGLTFCIGTAGMLFQFWLAKGKQMPEHAPHDRRRRRRRRAYDYDDWSDRDDDWTDDVYIERVPLPRRKRDGSRGRPYTRMEDTSHAREYKSSPARMRAEAPDMGGDIEKEDGGMMEENVVASVKRTEVRGTTGKGKATDVSHGVVRELRKFGTVELAESDAAEVTDAAEVVEEEVKSGLVHVSLGSDAENYLMRDMAIKV